MRIGVSELGSLWQRRLEVSSCGMLQQINYSHHSLMHHTCSNCRTVFRSNTSSTPRIGASTSSLLALAFSSLAQRQSKWWISVVPHWWPTHHWQVSPGLTSAPAAVPSPLVLPMSCGNITRYGLWASGIPIGLLNNCFLQHARVHAVDVSSVAVAYATYNTQLAGVAPLVTVHHGSWYEPVQHLRGAVGGIVSNPPYIPQDQMATLQSEVGRYEPESALCGGAGLGVDSLQVICLCAATWQVVPEMYRTRACAHLQYF
jgi:hypothetical protein